MEPHSPDRDQPPEPAKKREKAKPQTVEQLRRALSHAASNSTYERDEVTGITGRTISTFATNGTHLTVMETAPTSDEQDATLFGARNELLGQHVVSTLFSVRPRESDVGVTIEVHDIDGEPIDHATNTVPDDVLLKIEEIKMKHVEEEHPDPEDPAKKIKLLLASEQGVQDFLAELVSSYPTTETGEHPELLRKERERFIELVGDYFDFAWANLPDIDGEPVWPEYFFPDDPDVDTMFTIRDFQREGDRVTALDVSIGAHVADGLTMDHEFTIGKIPETGTDLYISTRAQQNEFTPQQLKFGLRRNEITNALREQGKSWDEVGEALRNDPILERLRTENVAGFFKSFTPQTERVKAGDKNLQWAIATLEHYKDRKAEVLSREEDEGI